MRSEWRIHGEKADFQGLAGQLGISPYTVRLLCNRKLKSYEEMDAFLYGSLQRLSDPFLLPDAKKAVGLLEDAIRKGKHIRIIGDYDIDGVCSIAVLYRSLCYFGMCPGINVSWEVPHRILDGFGLNEKLIRQAKEDGVELIVTCDNGIAAGREISLAKSLGMQVIVTDHHEVPKENNALAFADAVVDPKREDSEYPWSHLCGAGVAFRLMQALLQRMPVFAESRLLELLEFVAMATIGDVVDLQGENRILVQDGLARMRRTRFPGIAALVRAYGVAPGQIKSHTIGFQIGPALNAGGRLETARLAVSLLLSDTREEAEGLAYTLYELNSKRREMTELGVEQAKQKIEETGLDRRPVLVVYLPDCHESIAGIIAGRIREQYYRPTFIVTQGEAGLKGSGRSIPGYDMFHEMERIGHLFTKFGGHEMAAGFSLPEENLPAMLQQLNALCTLTERDLTEKIWIDIDMPLERVNLPFVQEIETLEPFGKGNESPTFAVKDLVITRIRTVGRERQGLLLSFVTPSGACFSSTYWGDAEAFFRELEEGFGAASVQAVTSPGLWNSAENNTVQSKALNLPVKPIKIMIIYGLASTSYRGEVGWQIRLKRYRLQIEQKMTK